MLLKINSIMRNILLVLGVVCVIFKLLDKKVSQPKDQQDIFQTVEFDDIW